MLQDLTPRGYILGNPYVTSDDGVVPDGDTSKNRTIAVYDDVIFEYGMALDTLDRIPMFVEGEAFGTEGDTLV